MQLKFVTHITVTLLREALFFKNNALCMIIIDVNLMLLPYFFELSQRWYDAQIVYSDVLPCNSVLE